jgi:hypothetical protein
VRAVLSIYDGAAHLQNSAPLLHYVGLMAATIRAIANGTTVKKSAMTAGCVGCVEAFVSLSSNIALKLSEWWRLRHATAPDTSVRHGVAATHGSGIDWEEIRSCSRTSSAADSFSTAPDSISMPS